MLYVSKVEGFNCSLFRVNVVLVLVLVPAVIQRAYSETRKRDVTQARLCLWPSR